MTSPRCFLAVPLLVTSILTAHGQWTQTGGPYGGDILALATDGTQIAAGTYAGVFVSDDLGDSWRPVNSGLTTRVVQSLHYVGSNLYAGTSGGVFLLPSGTSSWVPRSSGLLYTGVNCLVGSGSTLLAGHVYGLSRSTNGGTTWVRSDSGMSAGTSLNGFAADRTSIWAATSTGTYRSTDNGVFWFPRNTGLTSSYVWRISNVGGNLFAGTSAGLCRWDSLSTSWSLAKSNPSSPSFYMAVASGAAYLAGTFGKIFRSTDGGANWGEIANGLPQDYFTELLATSSKTFLSSSFSGLFVSSDAGASWSRADSGILDATVTHLLANGTSLYAGTGNGLFASTDRGATWTNKTPDNLQRSIYGLAADGTYLYAAVVLSADFTVVYRTSDGGASWDTSSAGLPAALFSSLFANNGRVFAATRLGLYLSTNGGTSWNPASGIPGGVNVRNLAHAGNTLYAATGVGLYASANNGDTWVAANGNLPSGNVFQVGMKGSAIFAAIYGYGVYKSVDAASHWAPVSAQYSVTSITTIDQTIFFTSPFGLYSSNNDGQDWFPVGTGLPDSACNTILRTGTDVYLGTLHGSVWRRAGSEIVTGITTLASPAPSTFSLSQNYPNPFNPATVIHYALPQRSHVTLTMFNTIGQQVATLVQGEQEAGYHKVKFDGSGLASGIYFYRLTAGSFVETKKLLLLR